VTDNSKQPGSIASSPQLLLTVPTPPWRGPYLGTMSLKPFSFSGNILCISKRPNIASSLCTNSLFSCPSSFSSSIILYKWDNVELYSKVSLTASTFVRSSLFQNLFSVKEVLLKVNISTTYYIRTMYQPQ